MPTGTPRTRPGAMATPDGSGNWMPPGGMPNVDAVHYWRELLTLLLVVLALPWLVKHLVTNPARVLEGRGPSGPA